MRAYMQNGILHDYPVMALDSAMSAPAPAPAAAALDEDDMRITVDNDGEITLILPRKTK